MSLYDTAGDLVGKAMRGLNRVPSEIGGISSDKLVTFLKGHSFDAVTARALALELELDPEALELHPAPYPEPDLPAAITRHILPFGDETVNSWELGHPEGSLLVDAGLGTDDLNRALTPEKAYGMLITHPHRDHIGGLAGLGTRLQQLWAPIEIGQAEVIEAGMQFSAFQLEIRTCDMSGHHPDSLGYFISAPEWRVFAPGDAVFAGSIGGCPGPTAYQQARHHLVTALATEPDDLIIIPGHGPATTLGTERRRNPFLAKWLGSSPSGT